KAYPAYWEWDSCSGCLPCLDGRGSTRGFTPTAEAILLLLYVSFSPSHGRGTLEHSPSSETSITSVVGACLRTTARPRTGTGGRPPKVTSQHKAGSALCTVSDGGCPRMLPKQYSGSAGRPSRGTPVRNSILAAVTYTAMGCRKIMARLSSGSG